MKLTKTLTVITLFSALFGCGGDNAPAGSSPDPSSSLSSSSSSVVDQTLWAGRDLIVNNSTTVYLDAEGDNGTEQWQQLSGPLAEFLTSGDSAAIVLTPSVTQPETLLFEVTSAGQSDQLSLTVEPCAVDEGVLFDECIAPGYGGWLSYESITGNGSEPFFHYQGQGDFHVQWQVLDSGESDHGNVVQVSWNANDPSHQIEGRGWFGLALAGAAAEQGADFSDYQAGALQFDMRLIDHDQPESAAKIVTKMECVYPCASEEVTVPNGENSYDWQTLTFPIDQLVFGGLDLTKVNHIFVIQPDWFNQEQAVTLQLDNIKLVKEYERPAPAEGCSGSGNMSYTLARSASPTADEQEAYQLITSAMDTAIEKYNCYSNLARHLSVQYNPDVATADGSPSGNIRFGARASMHYVTAMHEIAHTFGAGGSNTFRSLVVDGIFTGANATAKLREISGDPADQLSSDGTHFWPHGLNYISEGSTELDLIHHCWMVEAIFSDLGGYY